jgi:hypothetical protein
MESIVDVAPPGWIGFSRPLKMSVMIISSLHDVMLTKTDGADVILVPPLVSLAVAALILQRGSLHVQSPPTSLH